MATPSEPLSTNASQTISIRTLTGQIIPIQLPLDPTLTVANLKYAIEQEKGIPVDHQRLIFRGAELQDGSTLVSLGIEHECAVHLLLRRVEPVSGAPMQTQGVDYGTGQAGMIPVAIPIHDQHMAPAMIFPQQQERLIAVYRLGRAVKLFAIIDGIFLLIFALTYWLLALAIILPICGYYGATQYKRCYIYMYMIYLVGNVGLRIYLITQAGQVLWTLIYVVGIIIELYIMKIVWNFDKLIKDLTDEDKRELQYLQHPHRRM
jgi:hypothetical protein